MKRQQLRSELRSLSPKSFLDAKESGILSDYLTSIQPVYGKYSRQGRSFFRRSVFLLSVGLSCDEVLKL